MAVHKIKKGLDLPITGAPAATVEDGQPVTKVAVLGTDILGLKPKMLIKEGDEVKRGQPLFEHRKRPGLFITAPAAGKITGIHRGPRRILLSVVIELSPEEQKGEKEGRAQQVTLTKRLDKDASNYTEEEVRALMLESGLWTALRERPFSTVPAPFIQSGGHHGPVELNPTPAPGAIFVTAVDSHPGAPSIDLVAEGRQAELEQGLLAISKLTQGPTFFVKGVGSSVSPGAAASAVQVEEFTGKHPYGTVGVHIHMLWPVNRERIAWHLGLQDVIALGHLIKTGELDVSRVVSLSGPQVKNPRHLRTRLGASLDQLVAGELKDGESRVISGSVFGGHTAIGDEVGYLSRYHQQISVLLEGRTREFLGWLGPGTNKFSVIPTFISKFLPGKKYDLNTSTGGSHRAMVPLGLYERVMPMDIMATHLLRAIAMHDIERAEQLGCLELAEEDVSLCTFVDVGKSNYGDLLRQVLTTIQEEG